MTRIRASLASVEPRLRPRAIRDAIECADSVRSIAPGPRRSVLPSSHLVCVSPRCATSPDEFRQASTIAQKQSRGSAPSTRFSTMAPRGGRMMHLALLLGLFAVVSAGKGVTMATDRDFDSVVFGSGKNAFVKFLAPW